MARDVREIANAILAAAEAADLRLTNMSLNKIAYFAHAASLAHYGRPLVDSPFEAWQYGPVHPQLYRQLKRFKDQPVTGRLTRVDLATGRDVPHEIRLTPEERNLVDRITLFYGAMPAGRLVEISHEPGAPWDQVWTAGEREARPGMIISDISTESFYKAKFARSS
jgi:uncharacterized phage-associated protein